MIEQLVWKKSSYSGAEGGECVEAAPHNTAILVRDSKRPEGPRLGFAAGSWAEFVQSSR